MDAAMTVHGLHFLQFLLALTMIVSTLRKNYGNVVVASVAFLVVEHYL